MGPVRNLTRLIEKSGGIVVDVDFNTDALSAIYRCTPGLPVMFFVNGSHPGDRCRFSLAHELGHAIMHRDRATEDERVEKQADTFAGEFLIPAKWLVDRIKAPITVSMLAELKQEGGVSIQMLARQCMNAGLISPRRYQNIMIELSRRGWRRCEPINVPRENAEVFGSMIRSLRAECGFSHDELLGLLMVQGGSEFEEWLALRHFGPTLKFTSME